MIPDYIKSELDELYNFNNSHIINAADYGVPQMRERAIFLLVRKDQNIIWKFPAKKKSL